MWSKVSRLHDLLTFARRHFEHIDLAGPLQLLFRPDSSTMMLAHGTWSGNSMLPVDRLSWGVQGRPQDTEHERLEMLE